MQNIFRNKKNLLKIQIPKYREMETFDSWNLSKKENKKSHTHTGKQTNFLPPHPRDYNTIRGTLTIRGATS